MRTALRLALCFAIAAVAACPAAAREKKSKPLPASNTSGMIVVVVRSNETGCEPNCPEWIAASGEITPATPAAFRKVYQAAGNRPLPVLVDSPGGSVEAAMEIGKLIRKSKSSVLVAYTLFDGCKPSDKSCRQAGGSVKPYKGSHIVVPGYCMSACGFILAGGPIRMTYTNTIGTHQVVQNSSYERLKIRTTYRIVNGKKKIIATKVVNRKTVSRPSTTKLSKALQKKIVSYFGSMDVKPAFYGYFSKASPDKIYFLTETELKSTQIVNAPAPAIAFFSKETCRIAAPPAHCVIRR
jgi:hypothetical protein